MKQIPNILTASRIICSLLILFVTPLSLIFFLLYAQCGISDALDGFLARKMGVCSRFGEVFDSIADIVFWGVFMAVLIPLIPWQAWMIIWLAAIVLVRLASLAAGAVRHHAFAPLHTYANKATGLFLFFCPVFVLISPAAAICAACVPASLSAAEELYINLKSKSPDRNIRSFLDLPATHQG